MIAVRIARDASAPFLRDTIDVLAATLPNVRVLELPDQGHTANIAMPIPGAGFFRWLPSAFD